MNELKPIYTKKADCQDCYKCVRECPVKAIKIEDNSACIVDELKIPVLAYGLRSDFMGDPFEGSRYLLAWAEEISEIKTVCHCGKKATMNARIDENSKILRQGEQIEIGGNNRYIALCRKHFMNGIISSPKQAIDQTIQKTA